MWHEAKHGLGSGWYDPDPDDPTGNIERLFLCSETLKPFWLWRIRYRRKRREVKAKMAHTCVAFNSLIFSSNPTSSSDSHKLSFSSRFVFSYPSFLFRFRICVFFNWPFGWWDKLGKVWEINKFLSRGEQVSLNWVWQVFVPAVIHEIRNFLFSWEPSGR